MVYNLGGWQAIIPGPPVGKGRPRFYRAGKFVRTYTPNKTASWEATAIFIFKNLKTQVVCPAPRLDGPVRVEIDAHSPRPKRLMRKKDPPGRLWRTAKPDGDNVAKAVLDAMVKAELMRDDIQACDIRVRSWYCAKEGVPNVTVRWETIGKD